MDEIRKKLHEAGKMLSQFGKVTYDDSVPSMTFTDDATESVVTGKYFHNDLLNLRWFMMDEYDEKVYDCEDDVDHTRWDKARAERDKLNRAWDKLMPDYPIIMTVRNNEHLFVVKIMTAGYTEDDFIELWDGDIDAFREKLTEMGCDPVIERVDWEF